MKIAHLVKSISTKVPDDMYEGMAINMLLDGLRAKTQEAVELVCPRTLNEALTKVLDFEAVK